jgi:hypothetical protein
VKTKISTMAFVSLLAAATFCACNKDDNNGNGDGITFNVVGVTSNRVSVPYQIDTVKAEIGREELVVDEEGNTSYVEYDTILATAIYNNGGFTINLPSTVPDLYLEATSEWFDDELEGGSVTISNHSVKINIVELEAYKADGNWRRKVGGFNHDAGEYEAGGWEGLLMYASGNVTITGTYFDEEEHEEFGKSITTNYSITLKQGWNIIYEQALKPTEKVREVTMTTTAPTGAKWKYYESGSYTDYISGSGE